MKRSLAILCGIMLLGFIGWSPAMGANAPTTDSQLVSQLRAALRAKDRDAILALFNWNGTSTSMKNSAGQMVDDWLTRDIQSVTNAPLPGDFSADQEQGGIRIHLNVQPAGVIQLGFTDGFGFALPYGKQGDFFYLAGAIIEPVPVVHSATNSFIRVQVRADDGQPLGGLPVVVATPENTPGLHVNTLYGGKDELLTDDQGRLNVPASGTNLWLVAANKTGFGWLPTAGLTNEAIMRFLPWGRIDGLIKNRNRAVGGLRLSLVLDRNVYPAETIPPIRMNGKTTVTGDTGKFAFDDLPPLKFSLDREEKPLHNWEYFWSVDLTGGGTNELLIATRGRPVTGRIMGVGLGTDVALSNCVGVLKSKLTGEEGLRRQVSFSVANDGRFQAENVEPGDYQVTGDLRNHGHRLARIDPVLVQVPDDLSEAAEVPYDLGTVTLKSFLEMAPGVAVPDFSSEKLDGTPFKLSDLRGKYVLLDFWATWCGPCVGETPFLKATYDAFGQDDRFVMLSLSLDVQRDAPKKFIRTEDIHWQQAFLGDWSDDKITPTYGIDAIPAILLIGPDGKIIAMDLRGEKIQAAVAKALGH